MILQMLVMLYHQRKERLIAWKMDTRSFLMMVLPSFAMKEGLMDKQCSHLKDIPLVCKIE